MDRPVEKSKRTTRIQGTSPPVSRTAVPKPAIMKESEEVTVEPASSKEEFLETTGEAINVMDEALRGVLESTLNIPSEQILQLEASLVYTIDELSILTTQDLVTEMSWPFMLAKKVVTLCQYYDKKGSLPSEETSFTDIVKLVKTTSISSSKHETTEIERSSLPKPALLVKDSRTHEISTFSGKWEDWRRWYEAARITMGNNGWLHVAESSEDLTESHLLTNNSIYYAIAKATSTSGIYHLVKKYEPEPGKPGLADGRGAWKEIQQYYLNDENMNTMTMTITNQLQSLQIIKGSKYSVIDYIDKFLKLYNELKALGEKAEKSFSPEMLLHIFKVGIRDPAYNDMKMKCRQEKWTLEQFIKELRAEDLERAQERQADAFVNRRFNLDDTPSETTNEKNMTTRAQTQSKKQQAQDKSQKTKSRTPNFVMPNQHYQHLTKEEKKVILDISNFQARQAWYNKVKAELEQRLKNANDETIEDTNKVDNTAAKTVNETTKVNWKNNLKYSQGRAVFCSRRMNEEEELPSVLQRDYPFCLIDSGADISSLGVNWTITNRTGELIQLFAQGAIQQNRPGVRMERVSAITKVVSTDGEVILQIHNAVAPLVDQKWDNETLINPDQLRRHGVSVYADAHEFNGRQCFIIPHGDKQVIIPLLYREGKYEFNHYIPSDYDVHNLPIHTITSEEIWDPEMLETKPFDIQLCMKHRRGDVHPKQHQYNAKSLKRWARQLYCNDVNVLKKTLSATTQLAKVEPPTDNQYILQHEKRRLYEFKYHRLNETISMDLIVAAKGKISVRGAKYLAVYTGTSSKLTKVYPLKKKEHAIRSLQSFLCDVGIPSKIMFDGAKEFGEKVEFKTELLRYKIQEHQSEPYHQHQNRTESRNRDVKRLIHRILGRGGAPDRYWCYAAELAEVLLNFTAKASLNWRTPMEVATGDTPDISALYQFQFYDRVKYTTPGIPFPNLKDLPGRYLGIAWSVGDVLTYKIEPDNLSYQDTHRHVLLHRSAVVLDTGIDQRVNNFRGTDTSEGAKEIFDRNLWEDESPSQYLETIDEDEENSLSNLFRDQQNEDVLMSTEEELIIQDNDENIDSNQDVTPLSEVDDLGTIRLDPQYEVENNILWDQHLEKIQDEVHPESTDKVFEVTKILKHRTKNGKPELRVLWAVGEETWEPLPMLREECPEIVAEYIVTNNLKTPFFPNWAKKTHQQFASLRAVIRKNKLSRPTQLYGFTIPKNADEAYLLDQKNGNTLWADAIDKEMQALLSMNTFLFADDNNHPNTTKEEGWQYAPLQMIFTVKPDLRHKARLVIGGHVTEASMYDTYAATLNTINIRLLFHLIVKHQLSVISGDIANAYLNADTKELIYSRAGPEFGAKKGQKIIIKKALYGLKSSANAWYNRLSSVLRDIGFKRSSMDASLWYRLRDDNTGYDYIGHHVDDFIIAAKQPLKYLEKLKAHFNITGGDLPDVYLGQNLSVLDDESGWKITTEKYLQKCLPIVSSLINKPTLGKSKTPNRTEWHPELDESPFINEDKRHIYQQLIGIGIWLVTIGRIDIVFPISTLSRYTHVARENHFVDLVKVFEYLNRYPNRYITITQEDLGIDYPHTMKMIWDAKQEEMKNYYPDVQDEWNPTHPIPLMDQVQITMFVDADHATNVQDRRSITGIVIFLDKTLYKYISKRQGTIETSTFGAEFAAMRVAVEEAIAVINTLRSIGVYTSSVNLIGDNMSVINNTTIPGSVLKRKHLSIAYHKVREAVAAGIVTISHIPSDLNIADLLTKSLPTQTYRKLLSRCMQGQGLLIEGIDTSTTEHMKRSSQILPDQDQGSDG